MIETKSNTKVSALTLLEQLKKERAKLIASKTILDKKDNHVYPITNAPFKIPTHWVWCYLSDISLIQEGPGIRKHQYATSGIQFLTVTNILEGSVDLEKSKKYISKEQYKNYSHFTINKGDIVTACSGGSWGKSAIYELDNKLILNTSTLRLRFYNDLGDNYYLYYLTKTNYFKDSLSSYVTGQQPNYGYSHYSKIPIPLPPLPEQQRIVAILDEVFAAIAKARTNAEQNLKNAKDLFESYLQGVFENKGEGWENVRFENLCKLTRGHNPPKSKFISEPKEGYVRFYQIRDGWADDYAVYVPITPQLHRVEPEEILMVAYRHIGKVFRGVSGAFNVALCKISNKDRKKLDDDYLFYIIPTDIVKGELMKRSERSLIPSMSVEHLKEILIPLPPIKEQKQIVQKLDALSNETKKLEVIYKKKINDLEELKKSVLQKAFSGELKTAKALV